MAAAVSGAETRHGNKTLHACRLYGIDQNTSRIREKRCSFEDEPGREVDSERLDNYVDIFERVPDDVAIERIARYLIEIRILDW